VAKDQEPSEAPHLIEAKTVISDYPTRRQGGNEPCSWLNSAEGGRFEPTCTPFIFKGIADTACRAVGNLAGTEPQRGRDEVAVGEDRVSVPAAYGNIRSSASGANRLRRAPMSPARRALPASTGDNGKHCGKVPAGVRPGSCFRWHGAGLL
jgi:hypothetical protein